MPNVNTARNHVCSHLNLGAGVVTEVTFNPEIDSAVKSPQSGARVGEVEIVAREPLTEVLWYTVDGSTPTPNGPTSYILPIGTLADRRKLVGSSLKMLCAASAKISIQVVR